MSLSLSSPAPSRASRKILVVVDATKDQLSSEAVSWTLSNIARPGDTLKLLGILQQAKNPSSLQLKTKLGHKVRVEPGAFGMKQEDEVCKIFSANEDYFEHLKLSCGKKQVTLSTAIVPGFPARNVLLQYANSFLPAWVILDRFMKKEWKYLNEQLVCNIAIMDKSGKGKVRKLNPPPITDVDSEADASQYFDLDHSLLLNASAAETTMSCTSVESSIASLAIQPESTGSSNVCRVYNMTYFCMPKAGSPAASPSHTGSENGDAALVGPDDTLEDSLSGMMAKMKSFRDSKVSDSDVSPAFTETETSTTDVAIDISNKAPLPVRPWRASDVEVLELLGGTNELETNLFDNFVAEGILSKGNKETSRKDNQVETTLAKDIMKDVALQKLDRHFSMDENRGISTASRNQGAAPLCSRCNNKSPRFGTQPTAFLFSQIEEATNKFSRENYVAEGGYGYVFKGVLSDGQLVAVKQHKLASRQGDREFKAEVEVLSSAQHRNLVTLIGYCTEGGRRILVYEYVCNGSLHWHLSSKNLKPLNWPSRQKIALGAARGLRYLHEECRIGCIVHRDVRPNNILITHDFTALVADFGLARWQASGETAEQTRVIGTIGYVAPEYAETGQITEKADVYSFGLVLLEIITGRPAFDSGGQPGQQHLPDWASPLLATRAAHELLDKRIDESTVDEYELINMVNAAYLCIQKDPKRRPKMSQVVRQLEGDDRESTPLSPVADYDPNLELKLQRPPTVPRNSNAGSRPFSALAPHRKLSTVDDKNKPKISYDEML